MWITKDAQKRTKNASSVPGGVLFSAQSALLSAGGPAATVSSAPPTVATTLTALASMGCHNRLLFIREDVVDGGLSALSDDAHRGPGIPVSPSLCAVGLGLLKDRGHSLHLGGGEGQSLGHPLDAMGHSLRLMGGAQGLELRSLRRCKHFTDKSAAFGSEGAERFAVCVASFGAAECAHLLSAALANRANLFFLVVAQVERSHRMPVVTATAVSCSGSFRAFSAAATARASVRTLGGVRGVAALSEAHLRRHKCAEGQ